VGRDPPGRRRRGQRAFSCGWRSRPRPAWRAPRPGGRRDSDGGSQLAALPEQLLARERGTLTAEAVRWPPAGCRGARRPATASRCLEELVWDQIEAGADPRAIAPLTERLGFSREATGGEVIAS
jgi:hypothetical protein